MSRALAAALAAPLILLTACTGADDGATSAGASTGGTSGTASIPAEWVETTTEGWPGSRGFGSFTPELAEEPCLLADEVAVAGRTARSYVSGWGPFRPDPSDDVFSYVCEYGDPTGLRARLTLVVVADDQAEDFVELVLDQSSSADRTFESQTVDAGGGDVHTTRAWYEPGGEGDVRALFHDPDAGALVSFEVAGLDAGGYESMTAERVAEDLVEALGG